MKNFFVLAMFFVLGLFSAATTYSQVKISRELVVPKQCLGVTQTVADTVDWAYMVKPDSATPKMPYHKADYLDADWKMDVINLGGDAQVLIGWPTRAADLPITKVFGVVKSMDRKPKPNARYVSISYQPVESTCSSERSAIVKLLIELQNGKFGKYERTYQW